MWKYCHKLAFKYGSVIRLDFGLLTCVIVNRMEEAIEALVKKQDDFADRPRTWSGRYMFLTCTYSLTDTCTLNCRYYGEERKRVIANCMATINYKFDNRWQHDFII